MQSPDHEFREGKWKAVVWALGATLIVLALAIAWLAGRQSAPAGKPVTEARPVAAKTGYAGLDLHAIGRGCLSNRPSLCLSP